MAQLAHTAITDLRQAIRDGRSAIVVGPARSGLTWLVNQNAAIGVEPVVRFSVRGINDLQQVRAAAQAALGLPSAPERPSDLQLTLVDLESSTRPRLIIVNDCHRTTEECLKWLLEAALEPLAGSGKTAVPFVFEGAFDPDLSLAKAFPNGYSTQPLVHYVEPSIPWRVLTEVDDIMRGRWRRSFSAGLIPWIADISGGDVGLVLELLERLPNEGDIRDETLGAARRHVTSNGMRSREIRDSVREIDDTDLMGLISTGIGIPDVVPSVLEACALKRAYFAGIVAFDGIAGVYRVRGPMAAQLVAQATGRSEDGLFDGRFILARLLTYFAHIAAFELDLRSMVRPRAPLVLAASVSVETGLGSYQKKVKSSVVQTCDPARDALVRLSESLKLVLPATQSVLDQVRDRIGGVLTDDTILDGVTFVQLTHIARQAMLLEGIDDAILTEIANYRNSFAHFRSEPFGRCERLLQVISMARRSLEPK